jgi:hypothetical protein
VGLTEAVFSPVCRRQIYLDPIKQSIHQRPEGGDIWAVHIVDAIPDIENVTDAISPRPQAKGVRVDAEGNGRWGKCVYEGENDVNDQQVGVLRVCPD